MCKIAEAVRQQIKEKPNSTNLEISSAAVRAAAVDRINIGTLHRNGQSVSIEIGGVKQWFSL